MATSTHGKSLLIALLRGVLGGIAGGFAFAVVEVCLIRPSGWDNWLGYFLIVYIIAGLPFGILVGAILALLLRLLHQQTGVKLGLLTRTAVGTVLGMIVVGIWWAMRSDHYAPSYERSSWILDSLGLVLLGLAFGGIPGMVIGAQKQTESNPTVNNIDSRQ